MVNVVVTVEAMASGLHSGMFGGAAPDALAALISMLASLRDSRGNRRSRGWTTPSAGRALRSIPLCNVFADTYPDAEMILMGVEEPSALIHAPNESVDPTEIDRGPLPPALCRKHKLSRRDASRARWFGERWPVPGRLGSRGVIGDPLRGRDLRHTEQRSRRR